MVEDNIDLMKEVNTDNHIEEQSENNNLDTFGDISSLNAYTGFLYRFIINFALLAVVFRVLRVGTNSSIILVIILAAFFSLVNKSYLSYEILLKKVLEDLFENLLKACLLVPTKPKKHSKKQENCL